MTRKYKDTPPGENPDDQLVDSFMEGSLRADRFEELCDALKIRIRGFQDEISKLAPSAEREALQTRMESARSQLAVLRQEQAISRFVEDSVRATLRHQPLEEEDDGFER